MIFTVYFLTTFQHSTLLLVYPNLLSPTVSVVLSNNLVTISQSSMLNSLFFVNSVGWGFLIFSKFTFDFRDVLLEKHWKSVIHRSICDYFFDIQKKVFNLEYISLLIVNLKSYSPEDVPPIISTPHHYLINVYQNKMFLVAVITIESEFT